MRVGSAAWCQATGGKLSWPDKVRLMSSAIVRLVQNMPEERRWRQGRLNGSVRSIDVDAIVLPDSTAAKHAEEELQDIAKPYLVNHSIRTYVWSHIIGQLDGIKHDTEALYVASLLHDVALVEPNLGGPGKAPCFAVRGGVIAREFCRRHQWDQARTDSVVDTITHHLNPGVPIEVSVEAHLMNRGVLLDVIGTQAWAISKTNRADVVRRWPRHQMKKYLYEDFRKEAAAHPECRGQFFVKNLQFEQRVQAAPFAE